MRKIYLRYFLLLFASLIYTTFFAQESLDTSQEEEKIVIQRFEIEQSLADQDLAVITTDDIENGIGEIEVNGQKLEFRFIEGEAIFDEQLDHEGALYFMESNAEMRLYHMSLTDDGGVRIQHIPLWLSILPPLVAIALALLLKEVVVSLFVGIWMGAFIAGGLRIESFYYIINSFLQTIEKYIITALNDTGHLSVIVFSLLIGGMVAIVSKNGGMAGIVDKLSKYAKTERSTQFITWLLGVAIFFDDYANTLIVGNTMRSATDKFRISREKLAYIVDSTAAPVAAVGFITTWIGAELGYIDSGLSITEGWDREIAPYSIFLESLKYSFYPILTLGFILIIIYQGRDYGAMLKAEKRARSTGQVSPAATKKEDEPDMEDLTPLKSAPRVFWDALLPILTVILVTAFGLFATGMHGTYNEILGAGVSISSNSWGMVWSSMNQLWSEDPAFFMKLGKIIGNSDSYIALLWASLAGVVVAILMTVGRRTMPLFNSIHWMTTGFKAMMPAVIILSLAWSLALTTEELQTAEYLASLLEGSLNPYFLPPIIFILAAVIAFSTGSSWSTMAILFPIAIPTTWVVCMAAGLETDISYQILLNVIANVLAASVLGDHCSPISDTTILSSLASDCNHIDHVRTQLPYALTVGGFSLVCVTLSTLLGGSWLISFVLVLLSFILLWIIVRTLGDVSHAQKELGNNGTKEISGSQGG
jgi:Na+/H+ antiporter NhaC